MSHHFWPYAIDADAAPPLDADRYLGWLARRQWRTIMGGVLFGVPPRGSRGSGGLGGPDPRRRTRAIRPTLAI